MLPKLLIFCMTDLFYLIMVSKYQTNLRDSLLLKKIVINSKKLIVLLNCELTFYSLQQRFKNTNLSFYSILNFKNSVKVVIQIKLRNSISQNELAVIKKYLRKN